MYVFCLLHWIMSSLTVGIRSCLFPSQCLPQWAMYKWHSINAYEMYFYHY